LNYWQQNGYFVRDDLDHLTREGIEIRMLDLMPAVAPARFFCVRDVRFAIEARGHAQCSMMERCLGPELG
jgi:hypothetical protein